ncbi:hypothetical protein TNCV_2232611 [Trichonephila clavipes]|nr:hypothetical protein TNCV_2232611 [Trichonephila clavipes]
MDVLWTDHSAVNGVEWHSQTLNNALQTQCALIRFNVLYGRQCCVVLARTVESNHGGRFDGPELMATLYQPNHRNEK